MASNPLYDALKQQALHDYNLVSSLSPTKPTFPDWVITISFYMALHCVNAHAAINKWKWEKYPKKSPFIISRHAQALRYVSMKLGNQSFRDYNRLYQECWNARYDPFFLQNSHCSKAGKLFELAKKFIEILQ